MHTHPLIVVDGCETPEDAVEMADLEADTILDHGVYDCGGPVKPEDMAEGHSPVLKAGTQEYHEAITACLNTQRSIEREHWTVLRQAIDHFKDRDDPPGTKESFGASYKVGIGICGLLEAGEEQKHAEEFGKALWRANQLFDLLDGQTTADHMFYDRRGDQSLPVIEDARAGVYVVVCDFHY